MPGIFWNTEKRERRALRPAVVSFLREDEARAEEEKVYQELIERRAKRIPLQQITGEQEFMAFPFG